MTYTWFLVIILGLTVVLGITTAYAISALIRSRGAAILICWVYSMLAPFVLAFFITWIYEAADLGPHPGLPQTASGRAAIGVIWGLTPVILFGIGLVSAAMTSVFVIVRRQITEDK